MLFRRKNKDRIQTCPRCGCKMLSGTSECPECNLIFSRFEIATNKEAKAKKLRGDRSYIINTKKLPRDVSFTKLLLLSIFTGAFGGHCFYVGRYLRGSVLLADMLAMVFSVIFNDQLMGIGEGSFLASIATIYGLIEFLWFYDIFAIITKRFKVPVAIDLEGEMLKQKQEYMESLNELEPSIEEKNQTSDNETVDEEKTEPETNKKQSADVKKKNTSTKNKKKNVGKKTAKKNTEVGEKK